MRRILSAIVPALLLLLALAPAPTLASAACFCRYSASHASWDNADKTYCPSEVYYWGYVSGNDLPTATTMCGSKCGADGTNFVGVSSVTPTDWPNYGDPDNMVTDETGQCVFIKSNLSGDIAHWEAGYENCKEPLNSVAGKPWPEACSFCFCKYKKTPSVPDSCVGKFTMVHATSAPQECPALCGRLGLDPAGPATQNYNDACDFSTSDGCTAPRNINGEGCKTQQENAAIVKKNVLSSGSVVTMPLPLSNTSVEKVIARVISAILGIVGALALALFVWGGMSWMLAAGDSAKIGKAKQTIVWAALGLIAIFSSYAVLNFVINALT